MMKPPDGLWCKGWYHFAHHLASSNFGPRPANAAIDLIVIHSISLPPGEFGGNEVQRLFTNQLDWNAHPYFKSIEGMQVSAHFYIRRNGDLWQFVSADSRAWHAGESSYLGRTNCNDNSIGIELEGLEGGEFEAEQYESLAGLCAALGQQYAVKHVVGHEHVAPGRKADPGAGFKWLALSKSLAWPSQCFPEGTLSS